MLRRKICSRNFRFQNNSNSLLAFYSVQDYLISKGKEGLPPAQEFVIKRVRFITKNPEVEKSSSMTLPKALPLCRSGP